MNVSGWLGTIVVCTLLTGCGNFMSIHRSIDVDSGKGALIDIKQRGVFVSQHTTATGTETFVCAEPSPDAMAAYAAETSLSVPEKVQIANAMQEGATFTGLRTQSIQLLRDGMYRLCEARMSGAIDNGEYNLLIRRYQKNMVALLAIEQLTGTVKAPVTVLSSTGSATLAMDIERSEKKIEELQSEVSVLEAELSTEKAKDAAKQDSDKIAKLTKSIDNKKALIDSLIQGVANNRNMIATGAVTAKVDTQSSSSNSTHTDKVSSTVAEIVNDIINVDDLPVLCFNYYKNGTDNTKLTTLCNDRIGNMVKSQALRLKERELRLEAIEKAAQGDKTGKTVLIQLDMLTPIEHSDSIKTMTSF